MAPPASVTAGNTVYLSAQGGLAADGMVPKNFTQEAKLSLDHLRAVLRTDGLDFKDLVSITVYLKEEQNIAPLESVYWKAIGKNAPARTVLVVGNLPNSENIEISGIAVKATPRTVIHPAGWPVGAHGAHGAYIDPPAIKAGDVLYLSGQSGADPVTGKLPADFSGEVKQALENISTILKTAGMSMANVVWVNPYMSSTGAQERVMNKAYASNFEMGNTPGRGTFTVIALPHGSHIVFTAIAGADLAKRKAVRPRNERPSATASPGVLYGDTLYLSAKDAYVPGLGIISPDLDIQTRLSMRNLLDGLQEADMDFSNVVSASIYLRDVNDEARLAAIYGKFFKNGLPAQTVLQQNLDTKDIDTEQISVIAVRSPVH